MAVKGEGSPKLVEPKDPNTIKNVQKIEHIGPEQKYSAPRKSAKGK